MASIVRTDKAGFMSARASQIEFTMLEVQRLFQRVYRTRFTEKGLHFQQSAVLNYVYHNKPMTQTELAALAHIGRPAMGDLIDQLETKKLVRRANDPNDRRTRVIEITTEGESLMKEIDAIAQQLGQELRAGTTKEERKEFLKFLEKLRTNLNAMGPEDK